MPENRNINRSTSRSANGAPGRSTSRSANAAPNRNTSRSANAAPNRSTNRSANGAPVRSTNRPVNRNPGTRTSSNAKRKVRRKKKDNLSGMIKILIAACALVSVIVVTLAVKAVSDSKKDVEAFGSQETTTVKVTEKATTKKKTTKATTTEKKETTTEKATEAETTEENQTTTEREFTLNEITTEREFTPSEGTSKAAAEATTAGLVADDNRIIVDPTQEMWNLVVVNSGRKMPAGYKPKLAEVCGSGVYMDYRVAPWYDKMYNAAKQDGIILVPYSGYRSYERQERNYNNLTDTYMSRYGISRQEAAAKAATVILPPGTSEHNLGLAMDICNTYDSFATQKEYRWLMEHAHKYGFILRYEAEKKPITGIVPEPWHWRYVGVEYAEKIKNSGLCLEEYLDSVGIPY